MSIAPNSPYTAQKLFNDFTAWRSANNKIHTSSRLANISLPEIERQREEERVSFSFDISSVADFYNSIRNGLSSVLNVINNNDVQSSINTIDTELFDLQPTLDLFEQSLLSAKSSLDIATYQEAVSKFKELQRVVKDAKSNSSLDLNTITNLVFSQIERIEGIDAASGRKLANNVINTYIAATKGNSEDKLNVISTLLSDFLPEATLGEKLLSQAEPILGAVQDLLKTASSSFEVNTEDSKTILTDLLSPSLDSLSNITRLLPSNISDELDDITRQVTGIASTIDRGISAVTSAGEALQPLASKFGVASNVRLAAQTFAVPKDFIPDNRFAFGKKGSLNGIRSVLPSSYIQNELSHPRFNTSQIGIISDSLTEVLPDISNMRLKFIDTYRKMPAAAVGNPELANGPSLTTPILDPIASEVIGNKRSGTTVGDIVGNLISNDQVFIPRIG